MGVYRVEVSPNNRAGCHVPACKAAGEKIKQGEFRFAVQVTIHEHQSWQYRHWGCVTPKQIENLNETCGGDTDLVDGYDELPAQYQEKVKFALENGHIPDEDCTRDPESNRLGYKKPRASKAKKAKKDAEEDEDEEGEKKPRKKAAAKGKKVKEDVKDEDDDEAPVPAPKKRARKAKPKPEPKDEDEQMAEDAPVPASKKRGRATKKNADEEEGGEPKKARTSGRSKPVNYNPESEEDEGRAPKKARGRKAVTKEVEPEEGSEIDEEVPKPKKVPQKRGHKKATASDE